MRYSSVAKIRLRKSSETSEVCWTMEIDGAYLPKFLRTSGK